MQKILSSLIILLIPSQAFAFEDYLIMSSVPVKSVISGDNEIITAVPVFTIDNSKQTIVLKAKKVGKTALTITFPDGIEVIKVEVKPEQTILSENEKFEYMLLDKPPNATGKDVFWFVLTKYGLVPGGLAEETGSSTFDNRCNLEKTGTMNGYGCTAWVIYNENMDYLKCNDLSWNGKTKCK